MLGSKNNEFLILGGLVVLRTGRNWPGISRITWVLAVSPLVAAPPVITLSSASVDAGASLSASVPYQAGAQYSWTLSNGVITSSRTDGRSISFKVGAAGVSVVSCTLTDAQGRVSSSDRSVEVVALPDATITCPTYVGTTKTYTASVPSQAGATYAWRLGYGTIQGAANLNQVTFTPGQTYASDSLTCVVTNSRGTAQNRSKTLLVKKPPALPSVASSGWGALAEGVPFIGYYSGLNFHWTVSGCAALLGGAAPHPYTLDRAAAHHAKILVDSRAQAGETYQVTLEVTDCVGQKARADVLGVVTASGNSVSTPTWVTAGDTGLTASISSSPCSRVVKIESGGHWGSDLVKIQQSQATSCVFDVPAMAVPPRKSVQYHIVASGVEVHYGNDCKDSTILTLQQGGGKFIGAPPDPSITATVVATEGTAQLSAAVPDAAIDGYLANYLWEITNGWITSGIGTPSIKYQVGGPGVATLKCRIINFADRAITGTFTTRVYAKPFAVVTVPRLSETAGALGCTARVVAQPEAAYVWTVEGATITAGQGTPEIVYSVLASAGGLVRLTCKVSNPAGSSVSGVQSISVVAPPVITSFSCSPNPVPVGNPAKVALTGVFSGGKATVDQGVGELASNQAVLVQIPYTRTYTLSVINAAGTKVSKALNVPVTPGFYGTGSMLTPRQAHRAIVLENGQVLAAGGDNGSNALASAEVYGSSLFQATGSMDTSRAEAAGARLADGSVLLAGGSSNTLASADVTDTTSIYSHGVFTAGPLKTVIARRDATLTRLLDGRVLLAGGKTAAGDTPHCGYYDSTGKGSFTPLAVGLARPRSGHSATLLPSGRVLLVGGRSGTTEALDGAQVFDPGTNLFLPEIRYLMDGVQILPARSEHQACLLPDGSVLVTGGRDATGKAVSECLQYLPAVNAFNAFTPMGLSPRRQHSATLLPDGTVLLAGGLDAEGELTATAEVLNPVTGEVRAVGGLAAPRRGHLASLLPDGRVLITGGLKAAGVTGDSELFDMAVESPGTRILFFATHNSKPSTGASVLITPDFIGAASGVVTLDGAPFLQDVVNGKPFSSGALSAGVHTFTLQVGSATRSLVITVQ